MKSNNQQETETAMLGRSIIVKYYTPSLHPVGSWWKPSFNRAGLTISTNFNSPCNNIKGTALLPLLNIGLVLDEVDSWYLRPTLSPLLSQSKQSLYSKAWQG